MILEIDYVRLPATCGWVKSDTLFNQRLDGNQLDTGQLLTQVTDKFSMLI